jgi:hypothetical protein
VNALSKATRRWGQAEVLSQTDAAPTPRRPAVAPGQDLNALMAATGAEPGCHFTITFAEGTYVPIPGVDFPRPPIA